MRSLARAFDIASFAVVNDLEANARGVPLLGARDLAVVNDGEPDATGNCAVVSAGTGRGEAALVRDNAVAGEGTHANFAPRSTVAAA